MRLVPPPADNEVMLYWEGVIATKIVASGVQAPPAFCTKAKIAKEGGRICGTLQYYVSLKNYVWAVHVQVKFKLLCYMTQEDSQVIKVSFLHLQMWKYKLYYPVGVSHTHYKWHMIL